MKKLLIVILVLGCTFYSPAFSFADSNVKSRPNFVVFLIDDPGYADFRIEDSNPIRKPNIDRLAKEGIIFSNAYSTGCVCSPTRAGLMTGRYQQRFGMDANAEGRSPKDHGPRAMDLDQVTIAERLKEHGYRSAIFGKWHLGSEKPYLPCARGFDEFYGILHYGLAHKEKDGSPTCFYRNDEPLEERPENAMEQFCTEAISFIERNRSTPFFLYLPFTNVHGPFVGASPYIDSLDSKLKANRRKYVADIMETDAVIGRVMESLRMNGLKENTLVFCLGDNGGQGGVVDGSPLRGTKWYLWEGGIRVPFIVYGKKFAHGGRICDQPINQLDIAATVLSLSGAGMDPAWKIDGVDLAPVLLDESNAPIHEALFWRFGPQYAVRKGDWKLIKPHKDHPTELYNLSEDVGEKNNLAEKQPEIRAELQTLWDAWNARNEPQRWHDPRSEGNGPRPMSKKP